MYRMNFIKKRLNNDPEFGYYLSKDGLLRYPFIKNLHFYHLREPNINDEFNTSVLKDIIVKNDQYANFLKKSLKPTVDIYAAFQPFNEAFRSLLPFINQLQDSLSHGDYILNLWDRSGYTTSLLKSLFRDCKVFTVWEGNHDVLGYQGYYYWFGNDENINPKNS